MVDVTFGFHDGTERTVEAERPAMSGLTPDALASPETLRFSPPST